MSITKTSDTYKHVRCNIFSCLDRCESRMSREVEVVVHGVCVVRVGVIVLVLLVVVLFYL